MKIKEIEEFIEKLAPNHLQESYDNSGLLIGNKDSEVNKILITLDITDKVIDEAILKGCDMIISHHPIIFKGLKRLNGDNYVERIVMSALKNDIAIYSLHTNLDNVYNGVNFKICDVLKIRMRETLKLKQSELKDTGAGMIGDLDKEQNTLEFINQVKEGFGAGSVKYTDILKEKVSKIAVCGGSGSFLLQDAIEAGADVFITSDFTYHQFFDADGKIMIIDIGHYEFEKFTSKLILDRLQPLTRRKESVEFLLTDTNTNPVNYA